MKCTVEKDLLLAHLQKVCNLVGRKFVLPVLANLHLEAQKGYLILAATDLEIRIETKMKADVKKTGKTTVPAKNLLALASKFTASEVLLECDEHFHTTITNGNSEFKLLGLNPAEFPEVMDFQPERKIRLNQADLSTLIDSVIYVVDLNEARKVLQGVLFSVKNNALIAVATDGKRLAVCRQELEDESKDGDIIMPLKTAMEAKRLLSKEGQVELEINPQSVRIQIGDTVLLSKLIAGNYPNWGQIIPASFAQKVDLSCAAFLPTLDLVGVPVNGEGGNVELTFRKNELELYTQSSSIGEGKSKINVIYEGETELKVTFNLQFLLAPFKFAGRENLQFQINTPGSPIALEDGNFRYIIMPMRNK